MPSLPTFRRGQPLTDLRAADFNAIVDAIKARTILPSKGVLVRQTTSGVTLSVQSQSGSGAPPAIRPFELAVVNLSETESPDWKVRVYASTLAGGSSVDLGFAEADDPPYLLTAAAGVVQAGLTIDETGAVTSRWIELVPTLSSDTDTEFYVEIGTVAYDTEADTYSATNSQYGPIAAIVCRKWFTTEPPLYQVEWFGNS